MSSTAAIHHQVDHLFRHESGKMIAVLSKLLGLQNLETAQDIVQDTLVQAMNTWGYNGVPANPSAWLYRVAKNKAIDFLRRQKRFRDLSPQFAYLLQSEYTLTPFVESLFLDDEIRDSQLRMIFACCHPSIPPESQIALALKTLCGLNSAEIANAFLTQEETINKRIYRAKEKIKSEKIALEVPAAGDMPLRLDGVLKTLYLLFNEGYNSSNTDYLIREDLCEEALRLGYLLTTQTSTNRPAAAGLLALMCFQSSRLRSRLDDKGNIIVLKFQDRKKWFRPLMEKGFAYLEGSIESTEISVYQLEAAIAGLHARSPSFEQTDWPSIYQLYCILYDLQPTPVVALNKAIASAFAINKTSALAELKQIKGLENYYLYYTSVGEMYFELENKSLARENFLRALGLTQSSAEKQFLREKIARCAGIE